MEIQNHLIVNFESAQRDYLSQESLRCSFISCPYPTSEQNLLFSHIYFVSDLRERSIDNPFQTSKISTRLDLCKHAKFANVDVENVVLSKPNYPMPSQGKNSILFQNKMLKTYTPF